MLVATKKYLRQRQLIYDSNNLPVISDVLETETVISCQ